MGRDRASVVGGRAYLAVHSDCSCCRPLSPARATPPQGGVDSICVLVCTQVDSIVSPLPPPPTYTQGGADSVRVLVCTQVGAVPILAAIVKMPMSEMEP